MGHVLDVVCQTSRLGRNLQQRVLEALVGEVLRILRIHHAHPVNNEAVGVHVGDSRSEGDFPQASFCVALHVVTPSKLHVNLNAFSLIILVLEGYGSVVMTDVLSSGPTCHAHE